MKIALSWTLIMAVILAAATFSQRLQPASATSAEAAPIVEEPQPPKKEELLDIALELGKAHGFKEPRIVQAVLLQETRAGTASNYRVVNPGPNACFGPMQIKLAAAKEVLSRWPSLFNSYEFHTRTDDEIKANLILNERFNIEIATKYLLLLKQRYGYSGRQLLNAYNRGPGGVKQVGHDFYYAVEAEKKLKQMLASQ